MENIPYKNVGERLKTLRKTKLQVPYTQTQMSEILKLPYSTYHRYENDAKNLPFDVAFKLHELMGVNLTWLFTGHGPVFERDYKGEAQVLENVPLMVFRSQTGLEKIQELPNVKNTPGSSLLAFTVNGNALDPLVLSGSIVVVDRNMRPHFGQVCLYKEKRTDKIECRVFSEKGPDYQFFSCNPDGVTTVRKSDIEWVYPVVERY